MASQHWLILLFLGALGACVGSFLNVVVYRWPRGMSVVRPGSRCPHCGHPIRPFDNIPIVSWLVLGGRCRDCRGPVSSRYAWIEATVGLIFFGLAFHLFDPVDSLAEHGLGDPFRWALYVCQLILVCSLLCAYLIRRDGFAVPRLLLVLAVFGACGAAALIVQAQLAATSFSL
ncbi:MAG: prepilin peptidase [Planctomycetota bacterium]|nr:MAG: prepilin peptidase [Planctomycetota bacterium]REJ88458.1 MAG: prepilin peptidase [Planctomycetota bacterium]REK22345.1 MAG: prepilin peptidase [Planctomycetota bacterium]REK43608.1 MAG: prepilin peptidase [Planctomycetota bacterium]